MFTFTFHFLHTAFMLNKKNILLTRQLLLNFTIALAALLACCHQGEAYFWL